MIQLSRRQIKAADRVGGIELLIPWPPELGDPPPLEDDTEQDATAEQRAWVDRHVQPECQRHGLVAVRSFAARILTPRDFGGGQQSRLGVVIIGRRWVHATGAPAPLTMWYQHVQPH